MQPKYVQVNVHEISSILHRQTVVPTMQTTPRLSLSISPSTFTTTLSAQRHTRLLTLVLSTRQERLFARLGSYRGCAERLDEASVIQSVSDPRMAQ